MTTQEMLQIIALGEDSEHQFKRTITNAEGLAAEMVAFSNGLGGVIFVGVEDNGKVTGLSIEEVRRINQLISNVSSQHIRPAINPITQNVATDNGIVLVITVSKGVAKPYQDKDGVFWIKSGSDKRKATAREEIKRMFVNDESLHADEMPVLDTSIDDFDLDYFSRFFEKNYEEPLYSQLTNIHTLLENMHLMINKHLSITGYLLFAKYHYFFKLPAFIVKAVAFFGNSVTEKNYIDSRDIIGKIEDVYRGCISFFDNNLRHVQGGQDFNSLGELEIPLSVLQELTVNALIHRDYFISAAIRIFILYNRIEIISPGHLPNSLTIESIKLGTSTIRNSLLASFATRILPYRGIGTGIKRAVKDYPHITFEDDRVGNQFKVTIERPEIAV